MKKIITFIEKTPFTKFICSILIIGMAVIMTMNAVLRHFFHFSFNWGDEILRYINDNLPADLSVDELGQYRGGLPLRKTYQHHGGDRALDSRETQTCVPHS